MPLMRKFSVLISVYHKENHHYLYDSLSSIIHQTLVPSEIVLVKDGPLGEHLEEVISLFVAKYPIIKVVSLPQNVGLGEALSVGLQHCSHEFVARMDADDISVTNRFEKQFAFLEANPQISVLGTNLREFKETPDDISCSRVLPQHHEEIVKFSKFRCPVNHPTVMFRKSAVLESGNYQNNFPEDYYLWIKLISNGYKFHNLQENLLHFRRGNMIAKRKGLQYTRKEAGLFYSAYKVKHLNFAELLLNLVIKVPVRLLPSIAISMLYSNFLRSKSV
jgi:glycosyltransferase involved in cell wall biosynthesis